MIQKTMKNPTKKKITVWGAVGAAVLILVVTVFLLNQTSPQSLDYGYAREVSESEMALRQQLISTAELGLALSRTRLSIIRSLIFTTLRRYFP